jgi:hypothetical protein
MLSQADLRGFLRRLPQDFRLIINGATHTCNRQNLFAFSAVVRSANPSSGEFALDVPVPPEVSAAVVSFLHGGALDVPDSQVFDWFLLAAALGIGVVAKRLIVGAFRTLTIGNIEERFRLLRPFPDYLHPVLMFLDNNPRLFEGFLRANVLPPAFVRALLLQTANLFASEDDRFTFLRAYVAASDPPDFSLFRAIRLERLAPAALPAVFGADDIPRHCRTFPLVAGLIAQRRRLAGLRRQAALDVERLRRENAALVPRAAAPIVADAMGGVEERVRETFRRVGLGLGCTAACVSLLALADGNRLDFVARIAKLGAMSGELAQMLLEFQRAGGWLLYPGSSKASIGVTSSWNATVAELRKLTLNFTPDPPAAEVAARGVLSVAEDLLRGLTRDVL